MSAESYRRQEYRARINKAVDYIEGNLHRDMALSDIAAAAFFSPFHFHRLFRSFTGETVGQFVKRVRLEKAAQMLVMNPRFSVTRIAMDCGYASSAAFSRAFKGVYGMSPSEWRRRWQEAGAGRGEVPWSKNGNVESKGSIPEGKSDQESLSRRPYPESTREGDAIPSLRRRAMPTKEPLNVTVEDMEEMTVAYVRHVGPYKGDAALFKGLFHRLMKWAGPRNLLRFPETRVLIVYHDSPDITEEEKLRTSVCISVPSDTQVSGEVGRMSLAGGRYARARFELATNEYESAWNAVYGDWLPDSGYQPDDRPPFELYLSSPEEHPEGKATVEICVPVKPL